MTDLLAQVRYWPLGLGRIVTIPFGPRDGGHHFGVTVTDDIGLDW